MCTQANLTEATIQLRSLLSNRLRSLGYSGKLVLLHFSIHKLHIQMGTFLLPPGQAQNSDFFHGGSSDIAVE